ncbi:MAG: hypothetical protein COB38_10505 [Gammaproteobacteria bacterium]|nr:MAG: hypothetical protein COB38_10505 [Gammaproteobacteria bacterium]
MLSSIAPHASLLERGHLLNSNPINSNAFGNSKGISGLVNSHNNHQQSDSFAIFAAVLKEAYQKIAFSPQLPVANESTRPPEIAEYSLADFNPVGKISSKQAAQNILGFISGRLRSDAASGAEPEQLLERLDEGLEGFIKGFNEAKDIIEGLGLLTPELSSEINDTFERVTKGIEHLRERITQHAGRADNQLDGIGDINRSDNVSRLELSAQVSESSSFSLSLTTQDGDQVTIEISRFNRSSFSSSVSGNGTSTSFEINQSRSSSSSFSLNVIGELDEGELAAIDELLKNISVIADNFYSGRLEQAFDLAVELEIDRDELSSLNLQLQKTTTTQALASYQTNSQNELPSINNSEPVQLNPGIQLEQLLNDIQGLLTKAYEFDHPLQLVNDITSGVQQSYQPQVSGENLNDKLNSLISQFSL